MSGLPLLSLIVASLLALWVSANAHDRLCRSYEAWKSLALALEVELECYEDYAEDVPGEGCGARSKRLTKISQQLSNATDARWDAIDSLITLGERDDS
jgi:hypothetical protein